MTHSLPRTGPLKIPFPSREPASKNTIESKCKNTADYSAEIAQDGHKDYAWSNFIGPIPIA